ncbi:amino acid permease 8-like [Abrus precatorius]|uniref:Amino acid permease 8-like n=1 Tax=Abrus precatorius TaxID=3816 RepID=A0A8B8LKC7_ABRPR|nr:amino acid permease 8-like [Abrus precatorius]
MEVESGVSPAASSALLDDDGKLKRTGTVWTASAHIITAVVGVGVLSLPWAMAQLGWILGVVSIFFFALVTLYTSNLLTDCYRSPNPVGGKRNYTYMDTVQTHLGGKMHVFCGLVQLGNLAGFTIGFTITTSMSVVTILKNYCVRKSGIEASPCHFSNNPYMITFGIIEIVLSQIPNFHKLSLLSTLAAIVSFGYAFIGIGLSLATVIKGNGKSTSFFGGMEHSSADKLWNMCVALGNIALACDYAQIAIDIQDSLKSSPPENKVMKMANRIAIFTMTNIFLLSACFGYAAFGSDTPGNILKSSGFQNPFWLVDLANLFIIVHLVGAYQVVIQPFYRIVELLAGQTWPSSSFITREKLVSIGKIKFSINFFRLIWRSIYVVLITVLAMAMPFFNEMIALLGAIGFWPTAVFFPVQMFIVRHNIKKLSFQWFRLQMLSFVCLIVSLVAVCGAIHGLSHALGKYKPFMYKE